MIACVLIPRLELSVAAGGLEALSGRAVAVAPQTSGAGGRAAIGETSGAAQAYGVQRGMPLAEALARCPELELVHADPVAVASAWERVLEGLESIGAEVESEGPGVACFTLDGLRGLHAGTDERVLAAARGALERPVRLAAAPTRFCAFAAALEARPRRISIVHGSAREHLHSRPVELLRARQATAPLVSTFERLGLTTLGELAALSRASLTDRFGIAGGLAHRLAAGEDDPPQPRTPPEPLLESIELPEVLDGAALEHALELLIDRLLARPHRRGRPLRGATLAARLLDGGSWRSSVIFREALADRHRMALVLSPRLRQLPGPASSLTLGVEGFGFPSGEQRALLEQAKRAAAGASA